MALTCNKCNHENPDHSHFCNNCGKEITADITGHWIAINESQINNESDRIVNNLTAKLNEVAREKENDALSEFQQKAVRWVKFQFTTATAAVSVLLAFLAYVGYNGYDVNKEFKRVLSEGKSEIERTKNDYMRQIKDSKDVAAKGHAELVGIKNEAISEAKSALADITAKKKELDKFNTKQIEEYKKRLDEQVIVLNEMQNELFKRVSNINKIERSRYQILVHHKNAYADAHKESIGNLRSALYQKGFIIGDEDLFNVSTDKQEIIYFSNTEDMRDKVREIKRTIASVKGYDPDSDRIKVKLEQSGNNDPFQVVIKLCPKGVVENSAEGKNICRK